MLIQENNRVVGFGSTSNLDSSLIYAAQSYKEGGKRVHPIWMCTSLEHYDQNIRDRWLTAGNVLKVDYDDKTNITGKNYFGGEIIFKIRGQDFYEALSKMIKELSHNNYFQLAWAKKSHFDKKNLQAPPD